MQQTTPHRQFKRSHFTAAGVLLAAIALAAPAFALTVDTKGFVEIRGQFDRNLQDGSDRGTTTTTAAVAPKVIGFVDADADGTQDVGELDVYDKGTPAKTSSSNDNERSGVDARLRLWTEAAADENVKAVFAIEYDGMWGDTLAGDIGSDGKGQLEVKNAYLDFNLVPMNTNVKAGTQMFKIGGGFIANDDASGVQTATKLGDAAALKLYWVKALEGVIDGTSDDVDFYGTQIDLKAGDALTISPILAWTRAAKNTDIYFGGFDLTGKFGENTKLAATLIKNWGDNLGADNVDGIAAYAGVFQTMGSANLSLEGAWVGDDGRANGEFVDGSGTSSGSWGAHSPTEMLGGARYDARGGIGQALGASTGNSAENLYFLNKAYAKLGFGLKTSETTKLTTYVAHLQHATRNLDGLSNAIGQEVGAYYDITLAKGLTYSLMGAYLFNDDFGAVGGGNDDVYKLGTALTYRF